MFAYPKKTHTILPSVEMWGTNMNIQKDPYKSIWTRRIDKVGDTNWLNEEIDCSTDRACEFIRVYPRGIDPMKEINFQNNTSVGGLSVTERSALPQGKLPYRIMDAGSFVPPIRRQQDLLPLSRLPRLATSMATNPICIDYSISKYAPTKMKEASNPKINTCMRPTAVITLTRPLIENFEIIKPTQVIERSLGKRNVSSGLCTLGKYKEDYTTPLKEISTNTLSGSINSQLGSSEMQVYNSRSLDPDRYTKEILQKSRVAPISSIEKVEYIHKDLKLEKNLPYYSAQTNLNINQQKVTDEREIKPRTRNTPLTSYSTNPTDIGKTEENNSRDIFLKPKVSAGGFESTGNSIPNYERFMPTYTTPEPAKLSTMRKAASMFDGRYP